MKPKPMSMSTEMVRAYLERRKRCMRRPIVLPPWASNPWVVRYGLGEYQG